MTEDIEKKMRKLRSDLFFYAACIENNERHLNKKNVSKDLAETLESQIKRNQMNLEIARLGIATLKEEVLKTFKLKDLDFKETKRNTKKKRKKTRSKK